MKCPYCLNSRTEVFNSRPKDNDNAVWRRRRCTRCAKAFTTQETPNLSTIIKIKSPQQKKLVPYSPSSLLLTIADSLNHRQDASTLTSVAYSSAEQQLLKLAQENGGTVSTQQITGVVGKVLKSLDLAAYIKYMVHHSPGTDLSKSL